MNRREFLQKMGISASILTTIVAVNGTFKFTPLHHYIIHKEDKVKFIFWSRNLLNRKRKLRLDQSDLSSDFIVLEINDRAASIPFFILR